jgi:phage tail sheath protein FI
MPNLLTPGVYIQEVALSPSPIQGVSTSIPGFVGEAERGLVNGPPSLVTSFADFQRQYGNFVAQKPLAYAVQGFFANGGQQAFIARVANPSAKQASVAPSVGYDVAILGFSTVSVAAFVSFTIRAATVVGIAEVAGTPSTPTTVELIDQSGALQATLTVQQVNPTAGTLLVTSNVPLGSPPSPPLRPASFALRLANPGSPGTFTFKARDPGVFGNDIRVLLTPVYLATTTITGIVSTSSAEYKVSNIAPFETGMQVELANAASPSTRQIAGITVDVTNSAITVGGTAAYAVNDYVRALGWTLQVYYKGVLVETLTGISSNNGGTDGLASINTNSQWVVVPTTSSSYPSIGPANAPTQAMLVGTVDLSNPALFPIPSGQTLGLEYGPPAPPTGVTITFNATTNNVADVVAQINAGAGGNVIASTNASHQLVLSSGTAGSTALVGVTGGGTAGTFGFTTPASATGGPGGSTTSLLFPAGASIALGPTPATAGSDGTGATETDIIGNLSPPYSGLQAIEHQEGISIIAVPGWVSGGNSGLNDLVIAALIGQAERKQDRFAVFEAIDFSTNHNVDVNRLLAERGKWNSQYAAMYAPYVEVLDPLTNTVIPVPASGHIVGAYANTDNLRGVFKTPANVVLQGISGFSRNIPTAEQDLLNPAGVNVLRNFPGLGNVIWGGRTIAADPLWKYVSVRRLFIFIEQSLVQGTRFAVFEPNDLRLWARLRDSVKNFLTTQWRAGALFGATPQQAFFVRVDETTTTQDDRDNGIVNILVGLAPVKPAEFIVFQIGQASETVIISEQGT